MRKGEPTFKTLLMPDKAALAKNFTFAAGGAQCLIKDGKPQKLHPWPNLDDPAPHQPVPCAPDEAGYIPNVDWIQTTRATVGWSRDNKHFYLLFVKQTGTEGGAVMASHGHGPPTGGWTVSDEQRFWLAKGVWGAINSDGGDVGQLTYLLPDGNYLLMPPRGGGHYRQRLIFPPDFPNAPPGGTLLYFFVRDTETTPSRHNGGAKREQSCLFRFPQNRGLGGQLCTWKSRKNCAPASRVSLSSRGKHWPQFFGVGIGSFSQDGPAITYHQSGSHAPISYVLKGTIFFADTRQIVRGYPRILPASDYTTDRFAATQERNLFRALRDGEVIVEKKEDGVNIRLYKHDKAYGFATRDVYDGSNPLVSAGIENVRGLGIDYGTQARKLMDKRYPHAYKLADLGYVPCFEMLLPEVETVIPADQPDMVLIDVIDPDFQFVDRLEKERIAEDYRLNLVELQGRLVGRQRGGGCLQAPALV